MDLAFCPSSCSAANPPRRPLGTNTNLQRTGAGPGLGVESVGPWPACRCWILLMPPADYQTLPSVFPLAGAYSIGMLLSVSMSCRQMSKGGTLSVLQVVSESSSSPAFVSRSKRTMLPPLKILGGNRVADNCNQCRMEAIIDDRDQLVMLVRRSSWVLSR